MCCNLRLKFTNLFFKQLQNCLIHFFIIFLKNNLKSQFNSASLQNKNEGLAISAKHFF